MDNKVIGDFIKELMKSKDMNQEDLARAIGISPQAVSKSLNGVNTFDIGNLQIISELFEVTIDDLLRGNLNTSTSIMSKEERLVKLGINAVEKESDETLKHIDSKGKWILDYAIRDSNIDIIKLVFNRNYVERTVDQVKKKVFKISSFEFTAKKNSDSESESLTALSLSNYSSNERLIELLLDNYMNDEVYDVLKSSDEKKPFLSLSKLWTTEDDRLINLLYINNNPFRQKDHFINFLQAVRFENNKVIDMWFSKYKASTYYWDEVIGLPTAIKHKNITYIKRIFLEFNDNIKFNNIHTILDAYDIYNDDQSLLDLLLKIKKNKYPNFTFSNLENLMRDFYNNKDYVNLLKYKDYAAVPKSVFNTTDIDKISLNELTYLLKTVEKPTKEIDGNLVLDPDYENIYKVMLRLVNEIKCIKRES